MLIANFQYLLFELVSFCTSLTVCCFFIDDRRQLRVIVELVWPLVLFLILMWVKMDNKDLQERVHECEFCHSLFSVN